MLHRTQRKEASLFPRRILHALLTIFLTSSFAPHPARARQTQPSQQTYEVIVQNGAPMKTRDGVTLFADIYRPRADGKFPVILMRTFAAVTPPKASGTPSATNPPTATTPSSGSPLSRIRMEKSA
jgi:hypothetical protein